MKRSIKEQAKRGAKRGLSAEPSEGVNALADAGQDKRTLRTHAVEYKPAPSVTPQELIRVRKSLKIPRALFAVYLRTNVGGKGNNPDPVVWNVLGEPDRAWTFAHVLQEFEELGTESTVWSQSPMFPFTSDNFVHALHHLGFEKPGRGNSRAIIERPFQIFSLALPLC